MSQHDIAILIWVVTVTAVFGYALWEAGVPVALRRRRHRQRRKLAAAVATVAERHPALDEYLAWRDGCQWCRTEGPDTITRGDCSCGMPCGESWCGAGVAA